MVKLIYFFMDCVEKQSGNVFTESAHQRVFFRNFVAWFHSNYQSNFYKNFIKIIPMMFITNSQYGIDLNLFFIYLSYS